MLKKMFAMKVEVDVKLATVVTLAVAVTMVVNVVVENGRNNSSFLCRKVGRNIGGNFSSSGKDGCSHGSGFYSNSSIYVVVAAEALA